MKKTLIASLIMVVATTAFAGNGEVASVGSERFMRCKSSPLSQDVPVEVTFDFNGMKIWLNGELHEIKKSQRLNSYMQGTQFLDMSSNRGDHFSDISAQIPHVVDKFFPDRYDTRFDYSITFNYGNIKYNAFLKCDRETYYGPAYYEAGK